VEMDHRFSRCLVVSLPPIIREDSGRDIGHLGDFAIGQVANPTARQATGHRLVFVRGAIPGTGH
jgi:hypothetical protein